MKVLNLDELPSAPSGKTEAELLESFLTLADLIKAASKPFADNPMAHVPIRFDPDRR